MILHIVRGLPGSGKSTYAKSLNILHVETDMFCMKNGEYVWTPEGQARRIELVSEFVEKCLQTGSDCVVTGVFSTHRSYQPLIELGRLYRAKIEVKTCTSNYGSIHNVPSDVIEKMRKEFES